MGTEEGGNGPSHQKGVKEKELRAEMCKRGEHIRVRDEGRQKGEGEDR